MKKCKECGKRKKEIDFAVARTCRDGHRGRCKECERILQRVRFRLWRFKRQKEPKKCIRCQLVEPVVAFRSRNSYCCTDCLEKSRQKELERTRLKSKAVTADTVKCARRRRLLLINRSNRRQELIRFKGGECAQCHIQVGEEWPPVCFDFHHCKGKKEYNIAKLINSWNSKRALVLEELQKCIVLCSNCHRRLHHVKLKGELDES